MLILTMVLHQLAAISVHIYIDGWNSFFQVIKEPTRVTSQSATLLDLIITN